MKLNFSFKPINKGSYMVLFGLFIIAWLISLVFLQLKGLHPEQVNRLDSDSLLVWMLLIISAVFAMLLLKEIKTRNEFSDANKALEEELIKNETELSKAFDTIKQAQVSVGQQEKWANIGKLAAGVAHEINNPLGFVTSNVEMLEQYFEILNKVLGKYRELGAEIAASDNATVTNNVLLLTKLEKEKNINYIIAELPEIFKDIDEGLGRIVKIVRTMRLFSRDDTKQSFEEYDLNKGIENTLIIATNEIKYSAEVELHLGNIPAIQAIGSEINQVTLNLLVNAAQAIKEKSEMQGLIKITTWHDHSSVYCEIADNGPGILPENLGDVFNPFFTTKSAVQGTGIGLSISYDIVVNKHNGEILVDSKPGEGARFTIKLPLKQGVLISSEQYGRQLA